MKIRELTRSVERGEALASWAVCGTRRWKTWTLPDSDRMRACIVRYLRGGGAVVTRTEGDYRGAQWVTYCVLSDVCGPPTRTGGVRDLLVPVTGAHLTNLVRPLPE